MGVGRPGTDSAIVRRASWPVRVYRLGEEPPDDLSGLCTPEQRLAVMWDLAVEAWALNGQRIPDYARHATPVTCRRWQVNDSPRS